jgi:hypothetical protein
VGMLFRPFFRARDGFVASFRGWAGALVFLTTIGGGAGPRELIEDPGRTPIELPGLWENDGTLF